jgi:hypothetical protein
MRSALGGRRCRRGHRFEATQALRQVLNRAVAWKIIDSNPAKAGVDNPRRQQKEKRPFESWKEINAVAEQLGPRRVRKLDQRADNVSLTGKTEFANPTRCTSRSPAASLELAFLLLDDRTLSDRGELLDGVAERLGALRRMLEPRLLSADTFQTRSAYNS